MLVETEISSAQNAAVQTPKIHATESLILLLDPYEIIVAWIIKLNFNKLQH